MILDEIVRCKRKEVALLRQKLPLNILMRDANVQKEKKPVFLKALGEKKNRIAVIAEIKRKSPSKGILRHNFSPLNIAKDYERGGASALSILTDHKFFGGSAEILKKIRQKTRLPILRKDFIIDEYQVYESKKIGADAILLIAGVLSLEALRRLSRLAHRLGLDVLFEVHTLAELKKTLCLKPKLLGINNRNLKTFKVDISTTKKLSKFVPKSAFLVSESGIKTPENLVYLQACGVKAVLVGESLMVQKSPGLALRKLLETHDPS